jgi:hypothetical protein
LNKAVRLKKIISYTVAFIFIFMIALFITRKNAEYPPYTSHSPAEDGVKALFLLAERMGYETYRFYEPVKNLPDNSTMVAIRPQYQWPGTGTELEDLRKWIYRGNTLVLIDDEDNLYSSLILDITTSFPSVNNEYRDLVAHYYTAGRGKIILLFGADNYINKSLENVAPGIVFIEALDFSGANKVFFNEYCHGYKKMNYGVWDLLGTIEKVVFVQILLSLICLIVTGAVRFGRPQEVFEIAKREENERVFALSNLYSRFKSNNTVLKAQLNILKKELLSFLELGHNADTSEIILAASQNKMLESLNTAKILKTCESYIKGGRINTRKLLFLAKQIHKIRKEIRI